MNNFEYIIASLPEISSGTRSHIDTESILEEIRGQLSDTDKKAFDILSDGFTGENLTKEFYLGAAKSRSRFIRDYFSYDLGVRNCKAAYLNKALGRPEGQDVMVFDENGDEPFEDFDKVMEILSSKDILARERGLDDLMWERIDDIVAMDVFTLNAVLAFVAKLRIVNRWLKLDDASGRELFRKLVDEIRNNKQ